MKAITNNITTITIDKAKVDEIFSMASYTALYIVRGLLYIAVGVFLLLTIASGGDGRISDGNPVAMFISFGTTIFCAMCARLVTILMEMVVSGNRSRRLKRRRALRIQNERRLKKSA